MTPEDRALLEDAARAAGKNLKGFAFESSIWSKESLVWNPLADPGDALRLAVQVGICIDPREHASMGFAATSEDGTMVVEPPTSDSCAGACRAITRAAAEIWRNRK